MKVKIKYILTACLMLVTTLSFSQGNRRFPIGSVVQTTYDANAKAGTISLLNNNLSYQSSGSGNGFVRSTTSHTVGAGGGIYVYEVSIQASGPNVNEPAGIVNSVVTNFAQEPAGVAQVGGVNVSYSYYGFGQIYTSGDVVLQSTGIAYVNFDIVAVAFNAGTGTLTFYKNGVAVGTPITGLTGTWYAMSGYYTGANPGTGLTNAVFMASAMIYGSSYPSGFQGW